MGRKGKGTALEKCNRIARESGLKSSLSSCRPPKAEFSCITSNAVCISFG